MNMFEPLTRLLRAGLRASLTRRGPSEQAQRLAAILNLGAGELASIRMGSSFHYRPCSIAKRDGRERRLLAPSPALKTLQRRLLDNYLALIPVHTCATAFQTGASTVRNARAHARQNLIASVDLRDFFEATAAARVRAFFVKRGWRGEELATLMRLCVYRNGLPQGAPTSPCLSNLVNGTLDERLRRLAEKTRAVYTRYSDDLTFSWNTERMPGNFQRAVEDALQAAGYEIQPRKGWRVSPISARPCVTGLVLTGNGGLRVPWALRWRMWRLRWQSWWSPNDHLIARLGGYHGYLKMVK